jgi:histidinol dehydrogenase
MLRLISAADARSLAKVVDHGAGRDIALERRVATILADVKKSGDRAVIAYAKRFDALTGAMEVTRDEMADGAAQAPAVVRRAIRAAAKNIRAVARTQVPRTSKTSVTPGISIEQRVMPLDSVGCYVPGGRYPLPSSLLMTAIPARVAGVKDVIAVCSRPEPAVLCAAIEAGVDRLFRIGGAHAIGAMAFGTATIPRVDKIVGPGSAYVSAAKALVTRECAIDFHAGPTEIVIVASSGRPEWIAADLIAQAEHDVDARAIFITSSKRLATQVRNAVAAQLPSDGPAAQALHRNGAIILTKSLKESIQVANRIAPEHLVCDDETVVDGVCAGAVFVGPWSAQASGDYATGSNHVLPTSGASRFRGGLSAADFVRVSSVQRLSERGLRAIGQTVIELAEAEGLRSHAQSIRVRIS